ncbi:MAG: thioredoxin domain-containing protein [Rhizobiales bacterium]|nr:thioredoxin domain-containing protein [Hyphomicrobiales bacterium]
MNQNRVAILAVAGLLVLIGLGYFGYQSFRSNDVISAADEASTRDMSAFEAELMVPGPLGDMTLGDKNAPITVIEYASLTCSHCADFENHTFPKLKENYIDTGKVYYILRDFPFDPIATAAFMLAHCSGADRYFGFIEVLYAEQPNWAFTQTPMDDLKKFARQGGFSSEAFDACMKNEKIFEHVKFNAMRGAKEFGVQSTPTFFINGEKIEGALPYEDFDAILKKKLGGDASPSTPPEHDDHDTPVETETP